MLLLSLAGIALGLYMLINPRTRELGRLFSLWWVTGAAASSGVLMRDLVTFTVGSVCFLVAGVVFLLRTRTIRRSPVGRSGRKRSKPPDDTDDRNNKPKGYGKAVS